MYIKSSSCSIAELPFCVQLQCGGWSENNVGCYRGKEGLGSMVTGWVLQTMAVSAPPNPFPLQKQELVCYAFFLNGWIKHVLELCA